MLYLLSDGIGKPRCAAVSESLAATISFFHLRCHKFSCRFDLESGAESKSDVRFGPSKRTKSTKSWASDKPGGLFMFLHAGFSVPNLVVLVVLHAFVQTA